MKLKSKALALVAASISLMLSGCANKTVSPDALSQAAIEFSSPWELSASAHPVGPVNLVLTPMTSSAETFPESFPSVRITVNGTLISLHPDFPVFTPVTLVVDGNVAISSDQKTLVLADTYLSSLSLPKLHKPQASSLLQGLNDSLTKKVPQAFNGKRLHTPSDFLIQDLGQSRSGDRIILPNSVKTSSKGVQFQLVDQQ